MKRFAPLFLLLLIPMPTLAHVGYLMTHEEFHQAGGLEYAWLFKTLFEPINLALILLTIIIVTSLVYLLQNTPPIKLITKNLEKKETEYKRIFPWIIRLSLGIQLIGAGTSGYFISPILMDRPELAFIQTALGFMLLSGFLLEMSIVATMCLFLFALTQDVYMIGNGDFFALAMAYFIIGDRRPGIDDLLQIPCIQFTKKYRNILPFVLRSGIGFGMMFLAIYEKLLNPLAAAEVVRRFGLDAIIPVSAEMWVFSTGVIELFLGLFLFLGFYTRLNAAVAFVVLSLSFFFFGEAVASHITLFGTLSILFVSGGNKYSADAWLEKYRKKKKKRKR